MTERETVHELAAAYVLGALDPADRDEFARHLAGCDRCQADIVDFAPIPGLLRGVRPDELERSPVDVADAVVQEVGLERSRPPRRRERWLALTAAVAVLVAAGAIVVAFIVARNDEPVFGGPPVELEIDVTSGVTGLVTTSERDWGTRVEIDLFGVPARDRYLLWAVGTDGSWDVAASWGFAESGTCRVVGATRLHPDEIDRLVVTSGDKADELVSASSV